MMARGRVMYVPDKVLRELESITKELDLDTKAEAWNKANKYIRIGREKSVKFPGGRY